MRQTGSKLARRDVQEIDEAKNSPTIPPQFKRTFRDVAFFGAVMTFWVSTDSTVVVYRTVLSRNGFTVL